MASNYSSLALSLAIINIHELNSNQQQLPTLHITNVPNKRVNDKNLYSNWDVFFLVLFSFKSTETTHCGVLNVMFLLMAAVFCMRL